MKTDVPLLEPHTECRRARKHDGEGDQPLGWLLVLGCPKFTCCDGSILRISLALDSHEHKGICWMARTGGDSGDIIDERSTSPAHRSWSLSPLTTVRQFDPHGHGTIKATQAFDQVC